MSQEAQSSVETFTKVNVVANFFFSYYTFYNGHVCLIPKIPNLIHSFFFIRMLFSRARLNILIFPPILGCKYSCIILNNSL